MQEKYRPALLVGVSASTQYKEAFAACKPEYKTIFKKGEGRVKRHRLVDTNASDYKLIEHIALEKAHNGDKVEILPELDKNDPRRDKILMARKQIKIQTCVSMDIMWK